MKEILIVTTCCQCGRNARLYVYGNFSVGFCKKHIPDEYKEKIKKMGFNVRNI